MHLRLKTPSCGSHQNWSGNSVSISLFPLTAYIQSPDLTPWEPPLGVCHRLKKQETPGPFLLIPFYCLLLFFFFTCGRKPSGVSSHTSQPVPTPSDFIRPVTRQDSSCGRRRSNTSSCNRHWSKSAHKSPQSTVPPESRIWRGERSSGQSRGKRVRPPDSCSISSRLDTNPPSPSPTNFFRR